MKKLFEYVPVFAAGLLFAIAATRVAYADEIIVVDDQWNTCTDTDDTCDAIPNGNRKGYCTALSINKACSDEHADCKCQRPFTHSDSFVCDCWREQ